MERIRVFILNILNQIIAFFKMLGMFVRTAFDELGDIGRVVFAYVVTIVLVSLVLRYLPYIIVFALLYYVVSDKKESPYVAA